MDSGREGGDDLVEYVLLEIPSKPDYLFNEDMITISDLQTSRPKMTVGRKHLTGDYQDVMGTALIFEKHEERAESDSAPTVFGSLPERTAPRKQSQGQMEISEDFRLRLRSTDEAYQSCRNTWRSLATNAVRIGSDFVNAMLRMESVYRSSKDDLTKEKNEADLEKSSIEIETEYRTCLSDFRRCYTQFRSAIDSFERFRHELYNHDPTCLDRLRAGSSTVDDILSDLRSVLAMFARELVVKSAFAKVMSRSRGGRSDRLTRDQWTAQLNSLLLEPFLLQARCDRLSILLDVIKEPNHCR